jgi:hypothetical protein
MNRAVQIADSALGDCHAYVFGASRISIATAWFIDYPASAGL